MKLIFIGGSFNPPHRGHYEIIQYCSKQCDQLVLMPTAHSPLKNKTYSPKPHHILRMLELLIQDLNCSTQIDDWELLQSGPSYTYLTIQYLQQKYPESSISMVIGADQLLKFQQWKNYKEIIHSVHIIGFNRADCNFIPLSEMNITWVEDFNVDISSEEIREEIATGKLNANDLILPVKDYILGNNLYGYQQ